jgi:type I restriction enzyme S subunit
MLPEGWRTVPLADVAEVRTGIAKGKVGLKDAVDMPYLRVANVQDGHIDLAEIKTLPIESRLIERYTLKRGDVLMTEGGDFDKLGRGAVWQDQLPRCLHQNHVFAVRPDHTRLDSLFLSALSASRHGRDYFLSCAKRSTNLASINSSQIKSFPVVLPPIEEQRRIAEILSTWDDAIATAEQLRRNSQQRKQGFMAQILTGGARLPGYSADWTQCRLGDLFAERVETGRQELPLLSITRAEGVIRREDVGRKDTSNEDKSAYLRICPGDIGYNTMRMWQGVSALSLLEGIVSPAYTVLVPNNRIDPVFASHLFKLESVVSLFARHSQGLVSDTWNLKYPHFAKIVVRIPAVEEQVAIARVLSNLDKLATTEDARVQSLRTEKSALMAALLTGKRRVRLVTTEATP